MDWLGVLCFTNLVQEGQVGNRAPVDTSIEGIVFYQFSSGETSEKQGSYWCIDWRALCFTNLARGKQEENRALTDASIGSVVFYYFSSVETSVKQGSYGWIDRKYCGSLI